MAHFHITQFSLAFGHPFLLSERKNMTSCRATKKILLVFLIGNTFTSSVAEHLLCAI